MPKRRRKKKSAGLGVFLLVIAGVWFLSWKIFSGAGDFGGGLDLSGADRPQARNNAVFAGALDYPVAIIFDNHPDSQAYLAGLSRALVVYEALVEGGSTRFMGIFSGDSKIDKIGPVRSARPYFVEIASGWSAFLLHAGGSPEALDMIKSGKVDLVDLNEISGLGIRYFWRDDSIARPHNLFTSSDLVALGLKDFELNELPKEKLLWNWEEEKEKGKRKKENKEGHVSSIYVDFSEGVGFDAAYTYDPKENAYLREMGGISHVDYETGEQFAPTNVIIQKVPAEGYYPSGYGRISIDLEGEGDMLLFQNGVLIQGTWKKENQNDQTEYFNEEGKPIKLVQGQTWIEILPGDRVVSYE